MGCGASSSSKRGSGGPQELATEQRALTWIEKSSGLSVEACVARIKKAMELKLNVDDLAVLQLAREQLRMRGCGGTLVEQVYEIAIEYEIDTGWVAPGRTLWVGKLPMRHAQNKNQVAGLFERFGKVVSATVRYKPRSELEDENNKSWALVTFETLESASAALRGEVVVEDDDGHPHRLTIRPQAVEEELASNERDVYAARGKLAVIARQHAAADEETSRRAAEPGGRSLGKGRRRRSLEEKQPTDRRQNSKQLASSRRAGRLDELRAELRERGLDAHGSLEQLAGRLEEAAAVQGRGGGSGISAGFTFAHGCTLWVGGLPVEYASSGTGERKLRQAFSSFGTVVSINTRRKDMLDGKHKSWALITFADRKSARKVLRDSVQVMAEEGPVELDVKVAQVNDELCKPGTNSLAVVWAQQEKRIRAATKLQAAVRGHRARKGQQRGGRGAGNKQKKRHPGLVPMDQR